MIKLSEKKNGILDQLDKLKSESEQSDAEYAYAEDKDKLLKRIEEVFCADIANIAKALFALQFFLDGQVEFVNRFARRRRIFAHCRAVGRRKIKEKNRDM